MHPQNFNTLRRIQEEDDTVIQEEEEFIELASSEFLEQTLRQFLDVNGREALDSLPDGIHSGLVRPGARGVFFYFQGRRDTEKLHFWRYYDLRNHSIVDNRYLIANMINCQRDTPRIVDPDMFREVFTLQEHVITDILKVFQQQQALEAAPRTVDPQQQTIATVIQAAINRPDIKRAEALQAIRFLAQPLLQVQIKELRQAYNVFNTTQDLPHLLQQVLAMAVEVSADANTPPPTGSPRTSLTRDDLHLICFDFLSGG